MSDYIYEPSRSAKKFLSKTDRVTKERIFDALEELSKNPYAYNGVEKIVGEEELFRIRVGKYRILYEIDNNVLVIYVVDIDSRGGIYKGL